MGDPAYPFVSSHIRVHGSFTYRTARALFAGTGRAARVNLAVQGTLSAQRGLDVGEKLDLAGIT